MMGNMGGDWSGFQWGKKMNFEEIQKFFKNFDFTTPALTHNIFTPRYNKKNNLILIGGLFFVLILSIIFAKRLKRNY